MQVPISQHLDSDVVIRFFSTELESEVELLLSSEPSHTVSNFSMAEILSALDSRFKEWRILT